jgi:hypothetical protein
MPQYLVLYTFLVGGLVPKESCSPCTNIRPAYLFPFFGLFLNFFCASALLGYNTELEYGDAQLKNATWSAWMQEMTYKVLITGAIVLPTVFKPLLPQPGEGPDRDTMEAGWMNLHGRAIMVDTTTGKEIKLHSKFRFEKDVGYLYTAGKLLWGSYERLLGWLVGGVIGMIVL